MIAITIGVIDNNDHHSIYDQYIYIYITSTQNAASLNA